jgi:hypothetical protein
MVEIEIRGKHCGLPCPFTEWVASPLIDFVVELIDADPGFAMQRLLNAGGGSPSLCLRLMLS